MLGCLFAILAFFTPRLAIVLLWLFKASWLESCFAKLTPPFNGCFVPVIGLLFLPYTLLAYCFAWHQNGGKVDGAWIVLVVVAVLMDFGVFGQGSRARRKMRKKDEK